MRIRLTICLAAGITSAGAGEFAPRDYSPDDAVVIRTIGIKPAGPDRNRLVVAIGNRKQSPVDVSYACSLYDGQGRPLGAERGAETAVPPSGEIVSETASFSEPAVKASCRIDRVYD